MLGDQIGQETGQITGMRVLSGEAGGVKVEVSYQSNGTLLGAPVNDMGTYVSVSRPDGTLFAEGQGVAMTGDGEMVPWKGQGIGRPTGQGTALSWRGAIFYEAKSDRLARLNAVAVVFEFDTDDSGKTEVKSFEWK